jgi:hypothetical protein
VALALIATAAWNWVRFGSVLETGYRWGFVRLGVPVFDFVRWPEHLLALTISPMRGILLYAPILVALPLRLVSCVGGPLGSGVRRSSGSSFLLNLLFFSLSGTWDGGFGWGPRYLVAPSSS